MKKGLLKSTFRDIVVSKGRYISIMIIILLGVGFYSGLSITEELMVNTTDEYISNTNLYDYRLVSTIGFDKDKINEFENLDGLNYINGSNFVDLLVTDCYSNTNAIKFNSITNDINKLTLVDGRMPLNDTECVVDSLFLNSSYIGSKLSISNTNKTDSKELLKNNEYTVVGLIKSPIYMNYERGTTSIGNGSLAGFCYVLEESFNVDFYHEVYLDLNINAKIYSDDYNDFIKNNKTKVLTILDSISAERYNEILAIYEMYHLDVSNLYEPVNYVLTRNENISYVSFENDSTIVREIAKVFPFFFIMVAALVCVTTMSRMIEEQRTQMGILKSLGYKNSAILFKYLFYSSSAGILGCILGYFLGTLGIPFVIWRSYSIMYNIAYFLTYSVNFSLLLISLIVSLACTMIVTLYCSLKELRQQPSTLIRPKAPKAGKTILLERIKPLWKRLKFQHKISIRNIFRYKQRFIMMVLGVGGCTGLLLTGFGIKDSISNIATNQYEEIMIYDSQINFYRDLNTDDQNELENEYNNIIENVIYLSSSSVEVKFNDDLKNATVIGLNSDNISDFINLKSNKIKIETPKNNEVIISLTLSRNLGVGIGDEIELVDADFHSLKIKVTNIFDSYIDNMILVNKDTLISLKDEFVINCAFINYKAGVNSKDAMILLLEDDNISNVILVSENKTRIDSMMSSLNYIVLVIIVCAGALAFVVLYNLTNININERKKEIATIKVLGFYSRETSQYIFRENKILVFIGGIVGLFLGIAFHAYILAQIHMEGLIFERKINVLSYFLAFILTFVFNILIQIYMGRKINNIDMAESLKSVD